MFNKPKIYTVYAKQDTSLTEGKPVFVPEGFNVYAFIFGFFWALYHRLWIFSVLIAIVASLIMVAGQEKIISEASEFILQSVLGFYVGFSANDWYRASLLRRGYVLHDVVVGSNEVRAQQRYFEHALAAA